MYMKRTNCSQPALPVNDPPLSDRCQTLYKELSKKSDELSAMMQGVWFALRGANNPEACVQAAHSARELIEKLPQFFPETPFVKSKRLDDQVRELYSQWDAKNIALRKSNGVYQGSIDEDVASILAEVEKILAIFAKQPRRAQFQAMIKNRDLLSRPLSDYIAQHQSVRLIKLHKYFNKISHHRLIDTQEAFELQVVDLENLLLELVYPRSLQKLDTIDELIQQVETKGDKNKINQVLQEIQDSQSAYEHFFTSISSPVWINPLIAAGLFAKPENLIREGDFARCPIWHPMIYLEKIAKNAPKEVNKALLKMPINQNAWIHDMYVQTLTLLPRDLILQHITAVKEFTKNEITLLLYMKLSKLIEVLAIGTDKHLQAAGEVASAALDVQQDPSHKNPKTYFRDYEYQQIVENVVEHVGQKSLATAINIFGDLLQRTIELKLSYYNYRLTEDIWLFEDYASIHENTYHGHSHPHYALIDGLRRLLELLLKSDITVAKKIAIIDQLVTSKKYKIFYRISESVLKHENQAEYKPLYSKITKIVEPDKNESVNQLGEWSASQPSLTAEELLGLTIKKATQIIKSYEARDQFSFIYELKELCSSSVKLDPARMLKILQGLSDANWDVQYAMIAAFADRIDELNQQIIVSFVDYVDALSNHFDAIVAGSDFASVSSAKIAIIWVADKLIRQKQDKTEYVDFATGKQLIEIAIKLARDENPTSDDEAQYGRENMDSFTLAINTVRGGAVNMIAHSISWLKRYQSEDELVEQIYSELDWHLDIKNDPSPAIRSVYGVWFPWILDANAEWATANLDNVFTNDKLGDAAWDAYFRFNQPYTDVFKLLKVKLPAYMKRIDEESKAGIRSEESTKESRRFAECMMIQFVRGELVSEEDYSLLQKFFTLPLRYRSRALRFIGVELKENRLKPSKEQVIRLQNLFEERFNIARTEYSQHNQDWQDEKLDIMEFGSWFASGRFPDTWSWKMLIDTLKITKHIELDNWVLERLQSVSKKHPDKAVEVLSLMVEGAPERWSISSWGRNMMDILETVCDSDSKNARQAAIELIESLVAKGYYEYRAIAKKCEAKSR